MVVYPVFVGIHTLSEERQLSEEWQASKSVCVCNVPVCAVCVSVCVCVEKDKDEQTEP